MADNQSSSQPQPKKLSKKQAAAQQVQEELAPPWFPDAQWHIRTLGIIYAILIVAYFGISAALKKLPKPYNLRDIPPEMTPWLSKGEKHLPEEQLRAPESPTLPEQPEERKAPSSKKK